MTQYLSTVLRTLERLYRFRSSQLTAPEEIELGVPIQLVNDVSRMAMYGSGVGDNLGYYLAHLKTTHTVNGTLTLAITPNNPTQALNGWPSTYNPDRFQLWILRAWADNNDPTDFVRAGAFLQHSASSIGPAGGSAVQQARDNIFLARESVTVADSAGEPTAAGSTRPVQQSLFSVPIPLLQKDDGAAATIGITTTAGTGGTLSVDVNFLLWLGVKSATPPGLA